MNITTYLESTCDTSAVPHASPRPTPLHGLAPTPHATPIPEDIDSSPMSAMPPAPAKAIPHMLGVASAPASAPAPVGAPALPTPPILEPPAPVPPPQLHPLVTRARAGVFKPRYPVNLAAIALLSALVATTEPRKFKSGANYSEWLSTIQEENDAIRANDTWSLVPRPPGTNIVGSK